MAEMHLQTMQKNCQTEIQQNRTQKTQKKWKKEPLLNHPWPTSLVRREVHIGCGNECSGGYPHSVTKGVGDRWDKFPASNQNKVAVGNRRIFGHSFIHLLSNSKRNTERSNCSIQITTTKYNHGEYYRTSVFSRISSSIQIWSWSSFDVHPYFGLWNSSSSMIECCIVIHRMISSHSIEESKTKESLDDNPTNGEYNNIIWFRHAKHNTHLLFSLIKKEETRRNQFPDPFVPVFKYGTLPMALPNRNRFWPLFFIVSSGKNPQIFEVTS
jgi:hypothetical protein